MIGGDYMVMKFICESCKNEYSRETYTARDSKDTKKFWRDREGTEYGLCRECWQKQKEEKKEAERQKAEEESKALALPELQGTEKQIAWANQLRLSLVDKYMTRQKALNEKIEQESDARLVELRCRMESTYNFIINNKLTARWWIDNRENTIGEMFAKAEQEMKARELEETPEGKAALEEIQKIRVLRPEKPVDESMVEVKIAEKTVTVVSKKDERIIKACKDLGFKWDPQSGWVKGISFRNGHAVDRAAEIGNKLLSIGFPVTIDNDEAAKKAVNADFEPECTRWISTGKEDHSKLCVEWEGMNDSLYRAARSLPGSKYERPYVVVSIKYFAEVEDFAGLYGFKFSPGAQKAIAEFKASLEIKQVAPTQAPEQEEPKDGLKEILKSSDEVIDDLKDE
jgi:hypothetical protein